MSQYLGFTPKNTGEYYFLSYNSEDSDRAGLIATQLDKIGINIWYDDGLKSGENWEYSLAEKMKNCKSVLLFFTYGILEKEESFVQIEYELAMKFNKTVHVFFLDEIDNADVPVNKSVWWVKILRNQCTDIIQESDAPDKAAEKISLALNKSCKLSDVSDLPNTDQPVIQSETKKKKKKRRKEKRLKHKSHSSRRILLIFLSFILLGLALIITAITVFERPHEIAITSNMFLGSRIIESNDKTAFLSGTKYVSFEVNGENIELSAVPFFSDVNPANDDLMELGFLDRFGKEYYIYGNFRIKNNKLTLTSCESDYYNALPVSSDITFKIGYQSGKLAVYSTEKGYKYVHSILENKNTVENGSVILCGNAVGKSFNEMKSFSIIYDTSEDTAKNIELTYTDETIPLSPEISFFSNEINSIFLKWSEENRTYNGRREKFDTNGHISFSYINTYPYGFVLIDSDSQIYSYQNVAISENEN